MRRIITAILAGPFLCSAALAQTNVLTYHNDVARSGLNSSETILTPGNVNVSTFGRLYSRQLDGKVDAQPLYVGGVSIPLLGQRNVLVVATENDSVYALNADNGRTLWRTSLLGSGETPSDPRNCTQVTPQIGITSTPVINTQTSPATIYAVAMSKDSSGKYHQRLHALNLSSGQELPGSPAEIQAKYPGTGDNSQAGNVIFDPVQYEARAGLLLGPGGNVYIAWTSHCDFRPYTGWIMAYNATMLAQTSVIDITPNGSEGAFWGAGAGIAEDAATGNLFIMAGNGTFDTTLDKNGFPINGDYGNGFLKISTANNTLQVADYFNMFNTVQESEADHDLGSGGTLVLPDMQDSGGQTRHLAIGAGKDANIYIADRDNMGKFNPSNNNALYQEVSGALGGSIFSMPAYFNGQVYFGAVADSIRAFPFAQARLAPEPSSVTASSFKYPGATPSISANGTANGIVWAVENSTPAVLHAYLANDLATELYNSNQAPSGRDNFGGGNKFMVPTIVNGKVYVGTPNGVAAFGLLGGQLDATDGND
jgi:outer membrane protein assembly factor BamB